MGMRIRTPLHLALVALIGGMLLLTAACSNNDDNAADVANDQDQPLTGSPTALAGRNEETQEVEVTIHNGSFGEDEIELQEQHASVINVVNHDDTAYMLEIEELVAGSPIAAGSTTRVELTSGTSGSYTATLMAQGSTDALDTMTVQVVAPGNVPD
jgi:hypothetical protein